MIRLIEDAIIARLKQAAPDCEVKGFPEKAAEYRLTHPTGALLVTYAKSRFGPDESTDDVTRQRRRMEYDVFVLVRNLRDHAGAYERLDAARLALTGWGREDFGAMFFPVGEEFEGVENGVWTYRLTMAAIVPALALSTAESRAAETAPKASSIRARNLGEETVFVQQQVS